MEFSIYILPSVICFIMATLASIKALKSNSSKIWITIYIVLALLAIGFTVWQQIIILDKEESNNLQGEQTQNDIRQIKERLGMIKVPTVSEESIKKADGILSKPLEPNLKSKASHLVAKVYKFLAERKHTEPQSPRPDFWVEDAGKSIIHFQKTMSLYNERFAVEVIEIRNELYKKGYQDSELDKLYKFPGTPTATMTVNSRIEVLVESMP